MCAMGLLLLGGRLRRCVVAFAACLRSSLAAAVTTVLVKL